MSNEKIVEMLTIIDNTSIDWFGEIWNSIDKAKASITTMLGIAVAVLAILMIVCTIAILRSQKKTQKMLRELAEAQKKQEEDKP